MSEEHPSLETIADLLSGEIDQEVLAREVIPHLLARCPQCRRLVQQIRDLQRRLDHWNESIAVREGTEAPALVDALELLPCEERFARVEEEAEYQSWGVCQLLLERSHEAAIDEPRRSVELADLAVWVAEDLVEEPYHPDWVRDLRARAWAILGNARRVAGELHGAETAFRRAEAHLAAGTGRPAVAAEVLELKASLLRARRRLPAARALLDRALRLVEEEGETRSVGRLLVARGRAEEEAGELPEAIASLEAALAAIDPGRDPRLDLCARHNLLSVLVQAGLEERAASLLPEVRARCERLGHPLDCARLRWIEGRMAYDRGDLDAATAAFAEVQGVFLARGIGLDAALVSLDLALVYARQERTTDLKELAGRVLSVFHAHDIERETLAALLLFQRAVDREAATLDFLRELTDHLRKARG